VRGTPEPPSRIVIMKTWHQSCFAAHSFVRPRQHSSVPTADFSGRRVEYFPLPVPVLSTACGNGNRKAVVVGGPLAPRRHPHPRSSPCLSILWFGPCGAFFRPGRLIQQPARAAAVKDGRHADLTACSIASRPLLDGREHDGILARNGNARSQSSPLPINCSARKHIKIRDPAY
jgi:hypothetical protein